MDKIQEINVGQCEIGPLLSFIAEGLILFDQKGIITLVNPHASLLLDHTSEEMVGKFVDDIFPLYIDDKKIERVEGIVQHVLTAKKAFSIPRGHTAYLETRNQQRKFPAFISAKFLSINGEPGGILIFRDITTQKELENYKINTARRLSQLTPLFQKTATGDFSYEIEIPKQEDEFTELLVGFRLMIDDLKELEKEKEARRKLSEKYSQELEEEVKKKTLELEQSKRHIETIIETLTSGLVEYDSNFKVVRINRAAEEMLGVDRVEIVGQKVEPKDITKSGWKSLVEISYPALSDSAKKVSKEASDVDADMNEIIIAYPAEKELQVVTVPLTDPATGERRGFIKVMRDVTREKVISRSKSEFISIAAHQLRTPLSAVKWTMRLLIDGDLGQLNPSQEKMIKRGYDTNEKMISLVNDLLNVARIEDGRFGYEFKKGDIYKTLISITENSRISAKERNITLALNEPTEKIEEFFFDPDKLSLAFQNLVDNAIKYTPPGGTVSVSLRRKNNHYIEISFSDTGVGIPEDQTDRLFTKFFRAENVMHMQTSGSGLGLFIVKNIVARHGGTITVKSKENEGTTFILTIPTEKAFIPDEDGVKYY